MGKFFLLRCYSLVPIDADHVHDHSVCTQRAVYHSSLVSPSLAAPVSSVLQDIGVDPRLYHLFCPQIHAHSVTQANLQLVSTTRSVFWMPQINFKTKLLFKRQFRNYMFPFLSSLARKWQDLTIILRFQLYLPNVFILIYFLFMRTFWETYRIVLFQYQVALTWQYNKLSTLSIYLTGE